MVYCNTPPPPPEESTTILYRDREIHRSAIDLQSTMRLAQSWMLQILYKRMDFPVPVQIAVDCFFLLPLSIPMTITLLLLSKTNSKHFMVRQRRQLKILKGIICMLGFRSQPIANPCQIKTCPKYFNVPASWAWILSINNCFKPF